MLVSLASFKVCCISTLPLLKNSTMPDMSGRDTNTNKGCVETSTEISAAEFGGAIQTLLSMKR